MVNGIMLANLLYAFCYFRVENMELEGGIGQLPAQILQRFIDETPMPDRVPLICHERRLKEITEQNGQTFLYGYFQWLMVLEPQISFEPNYVDF